MEISLHVIALTFWPGGKDFNGHFSCSWITTTALPGAQVWLTCVREKEVETKPSPPCGLPFQVFTLFLYIPFIYFSESLNSCSFVFCPEFLVISSRIIGFSGLTPSCCTRSPLFFIESEFHSTIFFLHPLIFNVVPFICI